MTNLTKNTASQLNALVTSTVTAGNTGESKVLAGSELIFNQANAKSNTITWQHVKYAVIQYKPVIAKGAEGYQSVMDGYFDLFGIKCLGVAKAKLELLKAEEKEAIAKYEEDSEECAAIVAAENKVKAIRTNTKRMCELAVAKHNATLNNAKTKLIKLSGAKNVTIKPDTDGNLFTSIGTDIAFTVSYDKGKQTGLSTNVVLSAAKMIKRFLPAKASAKRAPQTTTGNETTVSNPAVSTPEQVKQNITAMANTIHSLDDGVLNPVDHSQLHRETFFATFKGKDGYIDQDATIKGITQLIEENNNVRATRDANREKIANAVKAKKVA